MFFRDWDWDTNEGAAWYHHREARDHNPRPTRILYVGARSARWAEIYRMLGLSYEERGFFL